MSPKFWVNMYLKRRPVSLTDFFSIDRNKLFTGVRSQLNLEKNNKNKNLRHFVPLLFTLLFKIKYYFYRFISFTKVKYDENKQIPN